MAEPQAAELRNPPPVLPSSHAVRDLYCDVNVERLSKHINAIIPPSVSVTSISDLSRIPQRLKMLN